MPKTKTKATTPQKKQQSPLVWFAVILAIVAFIIAFVAWNNTKQYPSEIQKFQTQVKDLQQSAQLEQARQQLEKVRQDIAQGKNIEDAQKEVTTIRQNLQITFQDAGDATKAYWQDLDQSLAQLQDSLRAKSIDALDVLDKLLVKFKQKLL